MKPRELQVGDKVRRKEDRINTFPHGRKVLTISMIKCGIVWFKELKAGYDVFYFELAEDSFEENILNAYKLIGQTIYWKKGNGELKPHEVRSIKLEGESIKLYNEKNLFINYGEIFEPPTNITVKLNKTHDAIVSKDSIVVGCQTFPISIIDDLVKAKNELEKF